MRKLLTEMGVEPVAKVRHRRSKVSNDRQGSRGKRRKKSKKHKPVTYLVVVEVRGLIAMHSESATEETIQC